MKKTLSLGLVFAIGAVLLAMVFSGTFSGPEKSSEAAVQKPATTAECPGKREKTTLTQVWVGLNGCRLVADSNDLKKMEFKYRDGSVTTWPLKSKPEEIRIPEGSLVFPRSLCRDDYTNKSLDYDCTPLQQSAQGR